MKKRILMLITCGCLLAGSVHAQWVVTDPTNLAQSIINTTKEIVQTSKTVKNTLDNFKEVEKLYNESKKYYDALKKVNNLVRDAQRVKETILMVGEISDIYVKNYKKMLSDPNFRPEELVAIANGYTKLLGESNNLLKELKQVVNITTLKMTDKERMDVVDRCYKEIRDYRNLVRYYTNKNISVSYLRAKKQQDTDRVLSLYGTDNERYW
ncbi:DUF4141 domain-containing protein [Tannerella forsythia]|uniref:DUF4141 domain-containing protein n=1 Tax=Tannerella forsythia TaxID=28112 RepID=UPI0015CF2B15|nr:DUF4141 domain-containing protein [Tannerella forsythia]